MVRAGQPGRGHRRARARRLGRRARPRARARGQARAGDDLAQARRGPLAAPLHARPASACPTHRSRRSARAGCPTRRSSSEVEEIVDELRPATALALRNRALVELVYSAGLRSAEAVGLDLGDVDFEQELVHVRQGKGAKDRDRAARRGGGAPRRAATSSDARPQLARGAENALFLSARGRRLDTSTLRRLVAAPAPPAPRVRDASARGRRRPAHDPGAARPLLALDDPDVQPRRRQATAEGLRPVPTRDRDRDADVEGFLALLAARRAPTTVEAYRRDLDALARVPRQAGRRRRRSRSSSATPRSSAPTGSRGATIARRTAAARSFYRHQQLLGARDDNPAAGDQAAAPRASRCRRRSHRARRSA